MLILFVLLLLKYNNYSPEIILSYLTIILGVFIKIFPSISKISISFININFYKPSVDLLFEKIIFKKENIKTEETINEETIKELNFTKDIQIKKISFSYPGSKKLILNELSLNIKKGETIGIMGETGSGKSTLANIIIGLVSPNNGGNVKVDGKNIQTNITGWYEKIGYVPQQVFLNNDTLKNNIIFYKNYHQADNKKIIEVIKSSQLEDFFISKNNDLNFMVGEDGKNLSGGQKQRIGIARSLYKDPELLIFDESTSSLDDKTEAKFVETINSIKDKTIIIISHKKSTLKNCDKIHYLNNGKILNDND
jgi:ABC-type multidrug transport system fused ATPase/permease subunit